MKRLYDLIRGLAATATIAALLAAVPYLLWRYGGLPGIDAYDAFTDPLASDETRTKALLTAALLTIAWVCWAQVGYALITETIAAAKGHTARRAPILPGIQHVAARLVAAATLTLGSLTPTATAIAAPLAPVTPVTAYATPTETAAPVPPTIETTTAIQTTTAAAGPTYVAGEHDTFWSIAEQTLGDGLRWQEIRDLNAGRTMPDGTTVAATTETVAPGWQLQLPTDAVTPLNQPEDTAGEMTVEAGDHFWAIAKDTLTQQWGRTPTNDEITPYWVDLVEANRDRLLPPEDPNLIYPGQHLQLLETPADPTAPPAPVIELPTPEPEPAPTEAETPPATPVPTTSPAPQPTVTPTPTSTPAPAIEQSTPDETGNSVFDSTALYAAGIGTLAVGAGAITLTLRRRRANQLAKRPPTTTIEAPAPEAAEYEQRLRPVADVEAVRWIEATNQLITARLAKHPEHPLPAVIAMRAGRFGVEVLLDEPCLPPEGFVAANDENTAWRLHPDLDLRMIEAEATDHHPYSTALATVGTTKAGDLLLDLEQLAAVNIEGDKNLAAGWMRSLATSLATNPWSQHVQTIAIGLDGCPNATIPEDPKAWCEQTVKAMEQLATTSRHAPHEARVHGGDIHHPTIVFITGDDHDAVARELAAKAQLVNAPLAVVTTTTLAEAERIHLDAKQSTLEPNDIPFTPAITDTAEAKNVDDLLDNTTEHPIPADPDPEPEKDPDPEAADTRPDRESVEAVIERINQPRPIEVQLLTPTPTITGLEPPPTGKLLAVICYLAYHRDISTQRLRDTFWPGKPRKTSDNNISELRRRLGTDTDGNQRLSDATNNGTYQLSNDIATDWHRLCALIEAAKDRPPAEAAQLVQAALEHVDGQAGRDTNSTHYGWLTDDHHTYTHIATAIKDAAHQLGEQALDLGEPDLANWAANQGLAAAPGNEAMYRLQMRAAAATGNTRAIHDAYQTAANHAAQIDTFIDVDPETEDLYTELTQPPEAQAS